MEDRPELVYKAAGKVLPLGSAGEPGELTLMAGRDLLGRVLLDEGKPVSVHAGGVRWRLRRLSEGPVRLEATDESTGLVACGYRARRLRAGGALEPTRGIALALRPRGLLRSGWTLRFPAGRVASLEPLGPHPATAVAIRVRHAVRGLPDATLVLLCAGVVVLLDR